MGLARATIRFNGVVAQVVSRSPSAATVVVPAGSGTATIRASDVMGTGTYSVSFTYG
jgi:hypothetical protein